MMPSRSNAISPIDSAMRLLRRLERGDLLRCGFFLMFGFPLRERLAVNALARLVLAEVHAALGGRFAIPVGEAVAAETGEYHQVDVLHIGALLVEMRKQPAEGRGFELGILIVHSRSPL